MPIHLACPSCSAAIAVSDRSSGRKASCPKCGQRFLVPKAESSPPEDEKPTPITFDVKPPEPKVVAFDEDDTPIKTKRKVRHRTPKVRAPLRAQKGIHPGCIVAALVFLAAVIIMMTIGVIEWRKAAMPESPPAATSQTP